MKNEKSLMKFSVRLSAKFVILILHSEILDCDTVHFMRFMNFQSRIKFLYLDFSSIVDINFQADPRFIWNRILLEELIECKVRQK